MARLGPWRTHTRRAINLQKSVTQLFIYDITAVLSLRRQKKKIRHAQPTQTLANTRTYALLCSKYGIPEVTRTGRSDADPEEDRTGGRTAGG